MTVPPQTPPAVAISVIVPVHNNPDDLRLCLTALRVAATAECEILVVDDASTDATAAVPLGMGIPLVRLHEKRRGNPSLGLSRACLYFHPEEV